MLNKRAGKTTLLWIPGHHGIVGNEETNACAKQAVAITDDAPQPVSFAAASALIHQTLTDPLPCQFRINEVYASPVYEMFTPTSSRPKPIGLTRQSTLNALAAERGRIP